MKYILSCKVQLEGTVRKSSFIQCAFLVTAAQEWNSVPVNIREVASYSLFKKQLKNWLIQQQTCDHLYIFLFIYLCGFVSLVCVLCLFARTCICWMEVVAVCVCVLYVYFLNCSGTSWIHHWYFNVFYFVILFVLGRHILYYIFLYIFDFWRRKQ